MADIIPKAIQETEAYKMLVNLFNNAGAPKLGAWLATTVVGDPTIVDRESELISLMQESQPYKERFSGLVKIREFNKNNPTNPIPVMTEAEYLNAENTYKQLLNPVKNLYGNEINKTIGELIGSNVSPAEVQSRITAATNWALSADQTIKKTLKDFYGVTTEDLIGYALNPELATAYLEKQAGVVTLAQEAYQTQVNITKDYSEKMLEQLVSSGEAKDLQEAGIIAARKLQDITTGTSTGYNPAAGSLVGVTRLAGIEGVDLTGEQVLGAALGTDVEATAKISGLKSRERARFEGASGGTNVLQENVSGTI
jgi:hypothetical protein